MSGHLKHLGCGMSRNCLTPDDDEVVYTLAYALTASPTFPETGSGGATITWTLTPTVGGAAQNSLTVTIELDYPGDAPEVAPTNTLNGWTNSVAWAFNGSGNWQATFTKATFATGSSPTFSFTSGAMNTPGIIIGNVMSGGSTEVPSATLTDVNVEAGDVNVTAVWDDADNSIVEDTSTQFTVSYENLPGTVAWNGSYIVKLSTGATTTSPTTVSNTDGWTIGTWTNPGGGYQWQTTISLISPPSGASTVTFATTPSTTGTIGLSATANPAVGFTDTSATDTLTVTSALTVDGTSGKGVPANAAEWTGLGLTCSHLYLLQEPSGNAADSVGSTALPATNVAVYQYAVPSWTRDAMLLSPESGDRRLNATGSPWPDKSVTSQMLFMYWERSGLAGSEWNIASLGGGGSLVEARITASEFLKIVSGANSATGAVDYGNEVAIPLIIQFDKTNSVQRLITHQEILTPTYTTPGSPNGLWLGAAGVNVASGGYLYAAEFEGASAELTRTQLKTLLQDLGWTVTWTP